MTQRELVTVAIEVICQVEEYEEYEHHSGEFGLLARNFERKAKAVAEAYLSEVHLLELLPAQRYAGEPNPHRRAEPAASMTTMPNPWDNH